MSASTSTVTKDDQIKNSDAEIESSDSNAADQKKIMLTLRSSDNEEFVIEQSAAVGSVTIKNLLVENFAFSVIPLPNVEGRTLRKVIEYLEKHADSKLSESDLKNFDTEFAKEKLDVIFEIILAANYLEISDLMDKMCQKVADDIKFKSVEDVREIFGIENDFSPEEEEKVRKEHEWAFEQ